MRRIFLALGLVLFAGRAWATCPTPLPFTLLNGTVADAGQVMANFNNVWNCGINQSAVAITGGTISGTLLSGPFTLTGILTPGAVNVATPLQTISFAPTGNSPTTLGSLVSNVTAGSANGREFGASFGMTSSIGNGGTPGNDKVALYAGSVGNAGSSNLWAANFLAQANTGFFGTTHFLQTLEVDLNNQDKDVLSSATPAGFSTPGAFGISIAGSSGGGAFRNTAAYAIGGGKFQFGFGAPGVDISQAVFYENTSSNFGVDLQGTHNGGAGIRVQLASIAADLRTATNERVIFRGHQDLSIGQTISAINDAGNAFEPLEVQSTQFTISQGPTVLFPTTFAGLPGCSSSLKGGIWSISDGSVTTWGSNAAGGGTSPVLIFCDGTNWTVAGK